MNIDRRIRGLEGRLTELEGGEDTRVDELTDKIEGIRQDDALDCARSHSRQGQPW